MGQKVRLIPGSGTAERSQTSDPEKKKGSWVGMTKHKKQVDIFEEKKGT